MCALCALCKRKAPKITAVVAAEASLWGAGPQPCAAHHSVLGGSTGRSIGRGSALECRYITRSQAQEEGSCKGTVQGCSKGEGNQEGPVTGRFVDASVICKAHW